MLNCYILIVSYIVVYKNYTILYFFFLLLSIENFQLIYWLIKKQIQNKRERKYCLFSFCSQLSLYNLSMVLTRTKKTDMELLISIYIAKAVRINE